MKYEKPNVFILFENAVFQCGLCNKYYNTTQSALYVVGNYVSFVPIEQQDVLEKVKANVTIQSLNICETCFNENTDGKGLDLVGVSRIQVAGAIPERAKKIL